MATLSSCDPIKFLSRNIYLVSRYMWCCAGNYIFIVYIVLFDLLIKIFLNSADLR